VGLGAKRTRTFLSVISVENIKRGKDI